MTRLAKLHLAVGADTGWIVAPEPSNRDADDGSQVRPLLDPVEGLAASFTGDGAHAWNDVHAGVAARHPGAEVIIPPRSSAVPNDTAETALARRDRHRQIIAEDGRMSWQKASRPNHRALMASDLSRWKRVIGDRLRSQTDGRQRTGITIAANVVNRMLELGRPEYVRVA